MNKEEFYIALRQLSTDSADFSEEITELVGQLNSRFAQGWITHWMEDCNWADNEEVIEQFEELEDYSIWDS